MKAISFSRKFAAFTSILLFIALYFQAKYCPFYMRDNIAFVSLMGLIVGAVLSVLELIPGNNVKGFARLLGAAALSLAVITFLIFALQHSIVIDGIVPALLVVTIAFVVPTKIIAEITSFVLQFKQTRVFKKIY